MKTVKCVSHFKAVTNKDSIRKGEKRASLDWSFDTPEVADIQAMDSKELEGICQVIVTGLESFGRTVLLKHAEDWEFTPTGKVSIADYVQFLNTETSRSRVVTKDTLELVALWYQDNCGLIGKPVESGLAGASVIRAKLSSIAGNAQALEIMSENLVSLVSACLDADEVEIVESVDSVVAGVVQALVTMAEKLIEESKLDFSSAL